MTPDPSLPGTPMGEAEEEGSGRGLLMAHNGESSSSPRLRARSVMIAEEIRDEGEEAHLQRTSTSFSRQESSKLRGKSFMVQANHNKQIYEALAEHTMHMYTSPRGVLDPRKVFMQRWDVLIAVLLLFTAVVTPYEVAFIENNSFVDPLFIINRIVDVLFFIDMVLQFNLMFLDTKTNVWITDRWRIARNYILGSFLIDICSILPFDTIGMAMKDGDIQKLKIFRIVRLMRLFKLLRIIRSGRVFKRLEVMLDVGYAMITLFKFIIGTLAIAHWMACAWMLVQVIEDNCVNWVVTYFPPREDGADYCDPVPIDTCLQLWPEQCEPLPDVDCSLGCGTYHDRQRVADFLGEDSAHMFITSFYWSLVTMSTIGYGDILPSTKTERVFTILAMIFGTSVFAYVVGSVCGIVANLDKRSTEFYELMDQLSQFGKENQIERDLQDRLKAYFRYRAQYTAVSEWGDLLRLMSPALRGEVAMVKCGSWVGSVPYFAGGPPEFMVEIAMRLTSETYPQWEEIIHANDHADKMYIVERGVVGCRGRVVVRGKVIGAELMLTNYQTDYAVRALTYTDLFALSRTDIVVVSAKYPPVQEALRKAECKEIARRQTTTFIKFWAEVSTGLSSHGERRSSFSMGMGLCKNAKDLARRQREGYLRDVALELLQAPGTTSHSPKFPEVTSGMIGNAIEAEELAADFDGNNMIKQMHTDLGTLRGEHREMRDDVASLKRMLQKVLAHKLQGEGAPAATLPQ
eukprot:jgi/Tetstr1/432360/TSEL_021757.t1